MRIRLRWTFGSTSLTDQGFYLRGGRPASQKDVSAVATVDNRGGAGTGALKGYPLRSGLVPVAEARQCDFDEPEDSVTGC